MRRCLELAAKQLGHVAPNPMVGCIIVHNEKIIGEGAHELFGGPHAEVNAINAVKDQELLRHATLYVNLEPCSHFGKTPPCADLIIAKKIPNVVIGCFDSNPLVKGKGVEKLREAGVHVTTGVLENECRELNRRFFTFHEKKRPYVILKWAESTDGYIDHDRLLFGDTPAQISAPALLRLSHSWRTQENAILVGTNTAVKDNPRLTARLVEGRQPVRLALDRHRKIPDGAHLFDGSTPTLVFTEKIQAARHNVEFIDIDFHNDVLAQVLTHLYERRIQSLIVEGGATLLSSFLHKNNWDEIRRIVSPKTLNSGVSAPVLTLESDSELIVDGDQLIHYRNA
jgi:diaminohydroxyphosphoribosylaminopyrimidine deaminase/5-amino-6-(5-phosphoribosylamino)uracil reductase